jgi:hypothetical protein
VQGVAAEFPWWLSACPLAVVRDDLGRHPLKERLGQTERPELLKLLNLLAYSHHLDGARPIFEDGELRFDGEQGRLARFLFQGIRAKQGVERVPGHWSKLAEGIQAEVLFALSYGGAQQATQALRRRGLDLQAAQVHVCGAFEGFGLGVEGHHVLAEPVHEPRLVCGPEGAKTTVVQNLRPMPPT